MPSMPGLGESVAEASERLNDILASEHDFPNLAAHIFLQRLFGESPLVFHTFVLEHNLLGKVYTPDVAVGIRYYHLWAKRFLSPENRSLILRDEEILGGKPASELREEAFRREVKERVKEMGIHALVQKCDKKGEALKDIARKLSVRLDEVAFIGDDLIDIPAFRIAGFSACPADAASEVKREVDYIATTPGGKGVFREIAEIVLKSKGSWRKALQGYV